MTSPLNSSHSSFAEVYEDYVLDGEEETLDQESEIPGPLQDLVQELKVRGASSSTVAQMMEIALIALRDPNLQGSETALEAILKPIAERIHSTHCDPMEFVALAQQIPGPHSLHCPAATSFVQGIIVRAQALRASLTVQDGLDTFTILDSRRERAAATGGPAALVELLHIAQGSLESSEVLFAEKMAFTDDFFSQQNTLLGNIEESFHQVLAGIWSTDRELDSSSDEKLTCAFLENTVHHLSSILNNRRFQRFPQIHACVEELQVMHNAMTSKLVSIKEAASKREAQRAELEKAEALRQAELEKAEAVRQAAEQEAQQQRHQVETLRNTWTQKLAALQDLAKRGDREHLQRGINALKEDLAPDSRELNTFIQVHLRKERGEIMEQLRKL